MQSIAGPLWGATEVCKRSSSTFERSSTPYTSMRAPNEVGTFSCLEKAFVGPTFRLTIVRYVHRQGGRDKLG